MNKFKKPFLRAAQTPTGATITFTYGSTHGESRHFNHQQATPGGWYDARPADAQIHTMPSPKNVVLQTDVDDGVPGRGHELPGGDNEVSGGNHDVPDPDHGVPGGSHDLPGGVDEVPGGDDEVSGGDHDVPDSAN